MPLKTMSAAKMKRSSKPSKKPKPTKPEDEDDDLDERTFADSLHNLEKTDPEFYAFLKENDEKLLRFNVDDDEDEDEDGDGGEEAAEGSDDDGEEREHRPSGDLERDSDESDFEADDGEAIPAHRLTLKTIDEWQKALQAPGKIPIATVSNVINAFHSALVRVSAKADEQSGGNDLKVEGSGVFNSVIQMCVLYLQPAVKRILGMDRTNKTPQKCKRWIKVKGLLKTYLLDLFRLLGCVTSSNILNVLLKHLHQMSAFVACFPNLTKPLYRRLVALWSTGEDTVRVLAFLCILRVTRANQPLLLDNALRMMYMAYVKNSKFVSPTTRPGISFMRRSLVEMFALDANASYRHAFLYVRQLAIHLRNAIVLRKKENVQTVYNWQYVNSMQLWAEVLAGTKQKPQLQSLVYPLVMIVTNAIKLVPTPQYYPLRFHCVKVLINLSRDADVFIPILPFILEVLTSYDFSKKHKKVSMKPIDFGCILRLSKSHLTENGFKDAVIDNVYALLLETLSLYSHTISFPDVIVMCVVQLKAFLKKCSIANYSRKIRMAVEKIEENVQFVESKRKSVSFQLSDAKSIKSWETTVQNEGTPLQIFYDNWRKLNVQQSRKRSTKNHELADRLPTINKAAQKKAKKKSDGPVELFPSDSENDDDIMGEEDEDREEEPPPKKAKKDKKDKAKKKKKASKVAASDDEGAGPLDDEVEDFNVNDW